MYKAALEEYFKNIPQPNISYPNSIESTIENQQINKKNIIYETKMQDEEEDRNLSYKRYIENPSMVF